MMSFRAAYGAILRRTRSHFSTHFTQTTMRKHATKIIGSVVVAVFLIAGAAHAMNSMSFAKARDNAKRTAEEAMRDAKMYSCAELGRLTAKCYSEGGEVCNDMQAAAAEHDYYFFEAPETGCITFGWDKTEPAIEVYQPPME